VVIVHECNNKLITTSSYYYQYFIFFAYTLSMNQYHSVKTIGLLLLVLSFSCSSNLDFDQVNDLN
jgi:hypothetical protein